MATETPVERSRPRGNDQWALVETKAVCHSPSQEFVVDTVVRRDLLLAFRLVRTRYDGNVATGSDEFEISVPELTSLADHIKALGSDGQAMEGKVSLLLEGTVRAQDMNEEVRRYMMIFLAHFAGRRLQLTSPPTLTTTSTMTSTV